MNPKSILPLPTSEFRHAAKARARNGSAAPPVARDTDRHPLVNDPVLNPKDVEQLLAALLPAVGKGSDELRSAYWRLAVALNRWTVFSTGNTWLRVEQQASITRAFLEASGRQAAGSA